MVQDIIRLPRNLQFLQRPLAQFISSVRAPKSAEGYAAIGGGSPLRRITNDQAQALQESLEEKGCPAHVYVGESPAAQKRVQTCMSSDPPGEELKL